MVTGELQIRVRYAECDAMGVVHHSVYPIWFEMGRIELLRGTGTTYKQMEEAGQFLVVAKLEIRYRRPALNDDQLTLRTHCIEVGAAKIRHEYELLRGTEVLAVASSTIGCVDRAGRVCPMPSLLREAIAESGKTSGA